MLTHGHFDHTGAALAVSEETGAISVAIRGQLKRNLIPEQLEELLTEELIPQAEEEEQEQKVSRVDAFLEKLLGIRGGRS